MVVAWVFKAGTAISGKHWLFFIHRVVSLFYWFFIARKYGFYGLPGMMMAEENNASPEFGGTKNV
jgi:hypothetical protein